MLDIYYSYNQNLQTQKNSLRATKNMEKVSKMWRIRNLTLPSFEK